ncbi:hypothetical protein AM1_2184 [Acaryochloris marina MBIC11017]|uniref:Uncharacterized protein n=1 Tax=Acaryochloris marina (strain MBIC 11017) TaxID=329726 RepID=B0BZY7_ACAM1|nr:hypothetical protein AM1_2184 [Acaryochloris marina MBIC11017]
MTLLVNVMKKADLGCHPTYRLSTNSLGVYIATSISNID